MAGRRSARRKVALALQRFEGAHQDGLSGTLSAGRQVRVEGMQGQRSDTTVGRQVRIILAVAIERRQRPLKEGR